VLGLVLAYLVLILLASIYSFMDRADALVTLAVLIPTLFAGWLLWVRAAGRAMRPAGPTLADHRRNHQPFETSWVVEADGAEYLVMNGPWPPLVLCPGGHPVYVFDRTGLLVDWTENIFDDTRFRHRWPDRFQFPLATAEVVAAWPGGKG
jgi:hypothetical protein